MLGAFVTPVPPVPFPSGPQMHRRVDRIPETVAHGYSLSKALLLLGVVSFSALVFHPLHFCVLASSGPTQVCVMYILPAPLPCAIVYIRGGGCVDLFSVCT